MDNEKAVESFDKFADFTPKKMVGKNLTSKDLSLVIDRGPLVSLISAIAKAYADCVRNTYGPGGYDTIIEDTNKVYTTKDGWTVARNLNMRLNSDLAALGRMVLDVPANVNLKVGDCTTTAILAAHELNVRVQESVEYLTKQKNVPMYEIKRLLVDAVEQVCDEVLTQSHDLASESFTDQVLALRDIALVSTNWNTKFADIIASIYQKTKNVHIRVEQGVGTKTIFDVIEGYDMPGFIQLPEYYVNDPVHQCYTDKHPIILMLDFEGRGIRFAEALSLIGEQLRAMNMPFVVTSPGFDNDFIKYINRSNQVTLRDHGKTLNVHPVVIHHLKAIDKNLYSDMAIILGAILVGNDNQDDFMSMITDVQNSVAEYSQAMNGIKNDSEIKNDEAAMKLMQEKEQAMSSTVAAAAKYIVNLCGSCDTITVDNRIVVFRIDKGMWTESQITRVNELTESVSGQLQKAISKSESLSAILGEVYDLRTRLGKLSCLSGIIRVGGYGDGDIKAVMDSFDDAIGACRSAFNGGYTVGGCYAIPMACHRLAASKTDPDKLNPFIKDIFNAFYACIRIAYNNYVGLQDQLKDEDASPSDLKPYNGGDTNPILDAIAAGEPYDIIAGKCAKRFIEPTMASIESLRGAMRLVKLIATSNQYLYKKYTVSELIGAKDLADAIEY